MQKLAAIAIAAQFVLGASTLCAQEEPKKVGDDRLIGEWVIISGESKGRVVQVPPGREDTFTFAETGGLQRKDRGRVAQVGEYSVDKDQDPAHMDLITKDGDKVIEVLKCIYRLSEDALVLAVPFKKDERPTEFDSQKVMIMNLKRREAKQTGDAPPSSKSAEEF